MTRTMRLQIDRGDAPFWVDVDVLSYNKGTTPPGGDDPTEVEVDSMGIDDFGNEYELTESEIEQVESDFLTAIKYGDFDCD